jgi:hypothetical protein
MASLPTIKVRCTKLYGHRPDYYLPRNELRYGMFILRCNIFANLPDFVRASNRVIVAAAITVGALAIFTATLAIVSGMSKARSSFCCHPSVHLSAA